MSRLRAQSSDFPIHITARCNNKDIFPVPMHEAWEIFSDYLHMLHFHFDIRIHLFVMMSNHFHLVVSDPNLNLSKAMAIFMRETSKEMNRLSGRMNRVWGDRYHSSVIADPNYFLHAYKYDYRNPVAAGACRKVEEYPWSTLQILLGKRAGIIPLIADETLFSNVGDSLDWLNESYLENEIESLQTARRKRIYEVPRDSKNNYMNSLKNHSQRDFRFTTGQG